VTSWFQSEFRQLLCRSSCCTAARPVATLAAAADLHRNYQHVSFDSKCHPNTLAVSYLPPLPLLFGIAAPAVSPSLLEPRDCAVPLLALQQHSLLPLICIANINTFRLLQIATPPTLCFSPSHPPPSLLPLMCSASLSLFSLSSAAVPHSFDRGHTGCYGSLANPPLATPPTLCFPPSHPLPWLLPLMSSASLSLLSLSSAAVPHSFDRGHTGCYGSFANPPLATPPTLCFSPSHPLPLLLPLMSSASLSLLLLSSAAVPHSFDRGHTGCWGSFTPPIRRLLITPPCFVSSHTNHINWASLHVLPYRHEDHGAAADRKYAAGAHLQAR
jgi:hypothetical protein